MIANKISCRLSTTGMVIAALSVGGGCFWFAIHHLSDSGTPIRNSQSPAASSAEGTSDPGDSPSRKVELPDSERSYLWQTEHRVLVLDFKLWPRLSGALRSGDRVRLQSFFASHAQARLLSEFNAESISLGFAEFRTLSADSAGSRPATVEDFIEHLLDILSRFDSGPQVSIRTVSLSPKDRDRLDGPWSGQFTMRVWGQDSTARPREQVVDVDFELAVLEQEVSEPAPWVTACSVRQESLRTSRHVLLPEVGKSWGFDRSLFHDNWEQPHRKPRNLTGGIYVTDFDLNGLNDVFVSDVRGSLFYRQVTPGHFEDVTLSWWISGSPPRGPVAFADFNNDGYPDMVAGNHLYQNNGRGQFLPAGTLPPLAHLESINGYAIADYDRDGLLDIYVTRAAGHPMQSTGEASWLDDRTGPGNSLLRNLGNWKFQDVTATSGTSAGTVSCFAAAWLDADGDMWPDLFVSDEFGSPVLLLNRKDGTFESRSITDSFGGFCMGVAAGDLDDDGRTDLYLANMYSKAGERVLSNLNLDLYPPDVARRLRHIVDGSELWRNAGNLRFEPCGRSAGVARIGWAYGPCLADLDNDGRLDIYAPAGFYSVSRDEPDG